MARVLTVVELSNTKISKGLEGTLGEVDRGSIGTGRARVLYGNINGLALPGNPDLLAAVGGLGIDVSIGTVVKGSDEVVVRVDFATGTSVTILSVPSSTEIGVKK